MSAAFTPGPWRAFEYSWCETSILANGFDHGICALDINHATEESQEADAAVMAANARLIAAAPDLFRLATELANLADGLQNGNSSAEYRACQIAEEAKSLVAKALPVTTKDAA